MKTGNDVALVIAVAIALLTLLFTQAQAQSGEALDNDVSSTSVVSTATSAVTPSALDEQRLFYDVHERRAKDNKTRERQEEDDGDSGSRDDASGNTVLTPAPTVISETPPRHSYDIHYDALLQSDDAIRIIINGMPCERVDRERHALLQSAFVIQCPALNNSALTLKLQREGKQLLLLDGTRTIVGTILPGESL